MITRCPGCQTVFRLSAEHLKMARGQVQCGLCNLQFDAIENLLEESAVLAAPAAEGAAPVPEAPATTEMPEWAYDDLPPPEAQTPSPPEAVDEESLRLAADAMEERDADLAIRAFEEELEALKRAEESHEERAAGPETPAGSAQAAPPLIGAEPGEDSMRREPDADAILLSDLPHVSVERDDVEALRSYLRESDERERAGSPWWGIAAALLLIAMLGQAAWYQRGWILDHVPGLRTHWQAWCEGKACALPPRRDVAMLHVVSRDVRDHPQYLDALLVNATIVNDAGFTQPFPVVELTLFDEAGAALGVRRFQPREYLDASVNVAAGMKPRQSIYVVLEIAGTSAEAVSFEFKFL
ncbi:MAG: hypothetical protein NFCOHLIN_01782 [Gammaproteobacteria bacterium]|nr:hypothetical protein [Gammaproteobacteria bacterium]